MQSGSRAREGLTSPSSLATTAGSTPHVILIRGLCKSYLNTTLITLFRNICMHGRAPGTSFPHVLGVCGRPCICTSVTGTMSEHHSIRPQRLQDEQGVLPCFGALASRGKD